LLGPPTLAGPSKLSNLMIDRNQCRQVTTEPITEEARNSSHNRRSHLYQGQSAFIGARPNKSSYHQAKFRPVAYPYPLPTILTVLIALTRWLAILRMLALDKVPHLIKLDFSNGKFSQQVIINLLCLERGAIEPVKDRFLSYTKNEANARERDANQKHLQ